MAVHLVTWDLNKEKQNYTAARAKLIGRLTQYEHIKDDGLDSVWFLSTSSTAQQVADDLNKYIDANDRLIVTRLAAGNYQGWLAASTWKWIESHS